MSRARHCGYRLKETGGGWSWSILHPDGSVKRQGQAPTRAIAAACVIQQLVQAGAPAEAADPQPG